MAFANEIVRTKKIMNCSIKTIISKDVFIHTKSVFRVNKSVRWITTVYDSSKKLFDGQNSECLAYIDNVYNVGYIHINRCYEVVRRLEKLQS
jgi:hypothetical protein